MPARTEEKRLFDHANEKANYSLLETSVSRQEKLYRKMIGFQLLNSGLMIGALGIAVLSTFQNYFFSSAFVDATFDCIPQPLNTTMAYQDYLSDKIITQKTLAIDNLVVNSFISAISLVSLLWWGAQEFPWYNPFPNIDAQYRLRRYLFRLLNVVLLGIAAISALAPDEMVVDARHQVEARNLGWSYKFWLFLGGCAFTAAAAQTARALISKLSFNDARIERFRALMVQTATQQYPNMYKYLYLDARDQLHKGTEKILYLISCGIVAMYSLAFKGAVSEKLKVWFSDEGAITVLALIAFACKAMFLAMPYYALFIHIGLKIKTWRSENQEAKVVPYGSVAKRNTVVGIEANSFAETQALAKQLEMNSCGRWTIRVAAIALAVFSLTGAIQNVRRYEYGYLGGEVCTKLSQIWHSLILPALWAGPAAGAINYQDTDKALFGFFKTVGEYKQLKKAKDGDNEAQVEIYNKALMTFVTAKALKETPDPQMLKYIDSARRLEDKAEYDSLNNKPHPIKNDAVVSKLNKSSDAAPPIYMSVPVTRFFALFFGYEWTETEYWEIYLTKAGQEIFDTYGRAIDHATPAGLPEHMVHPSLSSTVTAAGDSYQSQKAAAGSYESLDDQPDDSSPAP